MRILAVMAVLAAAIISTPVHAAEAGARTDSFVSRSEFVQIQRQLQAARAEIRTLRSGISGLENRLQQLDAGMKAADSTIMNEAARADADTDRRLDLVEASADERITAMRDKGLWTALAVVLVVALFCMVFARRLRRQGDNIDVIRQAQGRLQEESLALDRRLAEIYERQICAESAERHTERSSAPDHALALKIADEVSRMEMNISRMDPAVKGYRQLKAAIGRIKDNFASQGYELVSYIGRNYDEGMRINADFVQDETLPAGARIITSVIKPQVHYRGELLQKASVKISQNI